jgi:glycogen debranching enzyme
MPPELPSILGPAVPDPLRAVREKPAVQQITDAVVIKDDELFFLCPPGGTVPLAGDHGFGLYYHDCRYLNGYDLRLSGVGLSPLAASAPIGFEAALELTNPEFELPDARTVPRETLGVHWSRLVDGRQLMLQDRITVENYGLEPVEFSLSFLFRAEFEDVFQVRGLRAERMGQLRPVEWRDDALMFGYHGADALWRLLGIRMAPTPTLRRERGAGYVLSLPGRGSSTIRLSLSVAEHEDEQAAIRRVARSASPARLRGLRSRSAADWMSGQTRFHSDSLSLDRVVQRSLRDLRMLRTTASGHGYFSAGLPWYGALFGRDSAITAIQTLAFDPRIATETLRLLAAYQGQRVDEFREEAPGKILHEVRVGELAHLGCVPHARYYGSVDATPLFLILLGQHAAWTGDLGLFHELREPVDRALAWMDTYANLSGHGWLEYRGRAGEGAQSATNQGWKDSPDCITHADGTLASAPIALVEAQAYAWQAKTLLAGLFGRDGQVDRASALQEEADDLQRRFERDFWLEDLGCYALALDRGTRPCRVVSSNPGHALWAGIASQEHALATARRLMAPDVFSGWGIRTLASGERRYNPIGYHVGTVWPHDNALIGAGFRRYALDGEAVRLLAALVEAASRFPDQRLPELFAGFERGSEAAPVSYPVACHPQAWSAGSVPYLVQVLLGLEPEAFERRLRITPPVLPAFVQAVELRGLRVGNGRADLRFARRALGADLRAEVLSVQGDLDVVVDS